MDQTWCSRRSPVFSLNGMCASSQPFATKAGTLILEKGGNAADAAIAMASCLAVTEPCSTGLGGDCFALYFDARNKIVTAMNGSGKSPLNLTYEKMKKHVDYDQDRQVMRNNRDVNTITVPGACAAWVDLVEKFGSRKVSLEDILQPAVNLAENGFPVSTITSYYWVNDEKKLQSVKYGSELLLNGHAPLPGQIMKNPHLASVLKEIQRTGKEQFYDGWIAQSIVNTIAELHGEMSLQDLKNHATEFTDSIKTTYKNQYTLHEVGPNSQGIVALMALNIIEKSGLDLKKMGHNSTQYLHLLIEALRIAFHDARMYIADPNQEQTNNYSKTIDALLSKEYAEERRKLILADSHNIDITHGVPLSSSDTVLFTVIDSDGNACSMVNSNYMGFGTGIVAKGCGFTLQNRGANFSFVQGHLNCYGPGKRPYHTIIPAICTKNGELYASYGVMGGFMQPQGHVQVLLNMIEFGMDPQQALDAPRFCIAVSEWCKQDDQKETRRDIVNLEDGIDGIVIRDLERMGHPVRVLKGWERSMFGRGQIITRDATTKLLTGGSDPRADGCAIGLL